MGHQRTEVGQPFDAPPVYGPPSPGMGGPPQPMLPMMGGPPMVGSPPMGAMYTPAAGNVAYPTPAGIPQPPPNAQKSGGGRTVLLVVAGLIGVASVVAIVFAVRPSPSGGGRTVPSVPTPSPYVPPPPVPIPPIPEPPPPLPVPPHPTPLPVHPVPKYNGPECERARTLRSLGHPKEAESWVLACIAKGGNPN
jgi:hypothetical protein